MQLWDIHPKYQIIISKSSKSNHHLTLTNLDIILWVTNMKEREFYSYQEVYGKCLHAEVDANLACLIGCATR